MARHSQKRDTINKRTIQKVNDHNMLAYLIKVIPKPLFNRDFLNRMVWQKLEEGTNSYVFVATPESHDDYPENKGELIRARYPITMMLTQLQKNETKVDYLIQLDVGGSDSAILKYLGNIYLPYNLKRVLLHIQVQSYPWILIPTR